MTDSTRPVSDAPGELYVVSTPIGNLGDMTFRAVQVLREASVVLAEDTRHSRPLMTHFEVRTPLLAYHEHNEARMTQPVLDRLRAGERVALITDAGTPLLSDPGARLVAAAAEVGVRVVPVPGASALLSALVAAALPADRFTFYGFPPRKGGERASLVAEIAALPHTAVLYEAPGRVAATLGDLARAAGGDRPAAVARELTKQFEEVRRGTLASLAAYYHDTPPRGEVVLVVGGRPPVEADEETLRALAAELRAAGHSGRDLVAALTDAGATRNMAYRLAHGADAGVDGL
ncbi:MAG TPA: 16S rRNA (cytidine(1402)-2'-O)-methyltransferase [Gemmatimonadales bacterium]